MKSCKTCQIEKPDNDFYKGSRQCKKCRVAIQKEKRQHDPEVRAAYLAYQKGYQSTTGRRKKQDRFAWLDQVKSAPCLDCKRTFPPECMDFDHRDPATKEFDVSRAAVTGYSLERVQAEVEKCDVVCACCHRIRTAKQQRRGRWRSK